MQLSLIRFGEFEDGLPGRLMIGGKERRFYTIENNDTEFPDGTYECKRSFYHRGGYETFEILVPGRTRILFHRGNKEDDSIGCVIVGSTLDVLGGKLAVLDSKPAFDDFMHMMDGVDSFLLSVTTL